MCWDDVLCPSGPCCRYACCRKAIASAPGSQLRITELLPEAQLKVLNEQIVQAEEKSGAMHELNKPNEPKNHVKEMEKKILNDISPKIMEKLNQARNSLSATSYANLNIGNELKGLEEEDISVFAGIINYYEYYMWLKLLRQPQKWWTGSCERLGKTIMWYFIGIIFCICFGFPMWLLYVISGFISNSKLTSQEVGHLLSCGICCGGVESEVTLVSRCILTSKSSTRDSFTFSCYRSPTYYFPGTFGVFWNLARLISGAFSVQLMPDGAILASLLSGPTSRDLIVEFDNGDKLSANSDALQINQEIWNKFMSDEKIKKEIKQRFKEIKEEHDEFRKQHKIDSKDDEIDDKNFFI